MSASEEPAVEHAAASPGGERPESHGWAASLDLEFAARTRTCLARRAHSGPLVVQRPFYPEGPVCHAYIVHPPGGVVGGDSLELRVRALPGSHALLTTPAATKFYRNAGRLAFQRQRFELVQAALEWLPQETIFFPEASARLSTHVRLCSRSRFIGWEIACYGRPASALSFSNGEVRQDFELWLEDQPLVIDRLRLNGGSAPMRAPYGLASYPVLATMLAYPVSAAVLTQLREQGEPDGARLGASTHQVLSAFSYIDGALVARAVGHHVDRVRAVMENAWRHLRPHVLERPPVAPRIWST